MKTIIYYFTGTGNTLAAARALAEELGGDTKLIPLRRAMHYGGYTPESDAVGIAFPVHFLDMPAIVRQFVFNILFSGTPYIFGLATCGERPGGALFRLQELLEEKGYSLSAGFALVMPENFIGPDPGYRGCYPRPEDTGPGREQFVPVKTRGPVHPPPRNRGV